MGACSQCKITAGRDWTYTIYQPFQTSAPKADDEMLSASSSSGSAGVGVGVDGSKVLFRVSEGGEAGLMQDLGCIGFTKDGASTTTDGCNFTKPWFRKRLTDLGRGGGNSIRLGGGHQACTVYNVTGKLKSLKAPMAAHVVKAYCSGSLSVISKSFWQGVLSACEVSNVSLVFGVNYAVGTPSPVGPSSDQPPADAHWDPDVSGFTELLKFTAETAPTAVSHYELGNEPRSVSRPAIHLVCHLQVHFLTDRLW